MLIVYVIMLTITTLFTLYFNAYSYYIVYSYHNVDNCPNVYSYLTVIPCTLVTHYTQCYYYFSLFLFLTSSLYLIQPGVFKQGHSVAFHMYTPTLHEFVSEKGCFSHNVLRNMHLIGGPVIC